MKRIIIIIYTGLMFTLVVGLPGCYKDIIVPEMGSGPDDLPPKPVSYQAELAPMFNTSCAISACHAAGAHKPYLSTAVSYGEIVNGGFVNISDPKESTLYKMITGDMAQYMPDPVKINTQKVYDWIRNGAPNN